MEKAVIQAVHESLVESYPSLTLEYVTLEVLKLEQGEKPTNVIGMFAKSMLTKAGYLR